MTSVEVGCVIGTHASMEATAASIQLPWKFESCRVRQASTEFRRLPRKPTEPVALTSVEAGQIKAIEAFMEVGLTSVEAVVEVGQELVPTREN